MTIIKSIALLKYYTQPYVPPVITLLQIIVNQVLYTMHTCSHRWSIQGYANFAQRHLNSYIKRRRRGVSNSLKAVYYVIRHTFVIEYDNALSSTSYYGSVLCTFIIVVCIIVMLLSTQKLIQESYRIQVY